MANCSKKRRSNPVICKDCNVEMSGPKESMGHVVKGHLVVEAPRGWKA
jgi:hypothetical protein